MKKALVLAALMTLPTFAGQKVVIAPTPVVTNPTITNPCEGSVWSWEVAGTYSWGANNPYDDADGMPQKKVNTYGADVTVVRQLPDYGWFKNHALFLRIGYNWGDRTWGLGEGLNTKFSAGNFSIMPGYRMSHKITDSLSYHVGGSIGITNRSDESQFSTTMPVYSTPAVDENIYYLQNSADGQFLPPNMQYNDRQPAEPEVIGTETVTSTSSKSTMGFAASLELGLTYDINPCWNVFCSYQVTMNTARTKFNHMGEEIKSKRQLSHGIRLGVGRKF